MSTKSLQNKYLLFTLIFVVFYPSKGLLNLLYYFIQFEAIPGIFNKFIFVLIITSLLILLLFNKFDLNKYLVHLIFTFIALVLSTIKGDIHLISKVLMLFILPILLSVYNNVSEINIEKIIRAFFKFTLIYIAIEYILLNIRIDGINLISQEIYQTLYSILTPDGTTIDYRHHGSWWTFRSGGYLADPLAMPVLVVMSTVYFYLYYRLYNRYLSYAILGIFFVISTLSTTAIISLLFTIIMYEMNNFRLRKFITVIIFTTIIVLFHHTVGHIFLRISNNFTNPEYMSKFINYEFIYELNIYYNLILGEWTWYNPNIGSHMDIMLIVNSMGLIGIYILYIIFIRGFLVYRKNNNIFTVYSYILLSALVTLYHHGMTLNVNVIILVVLISSRVNNSIKSKINSDIFNLLSQINHIIQSKIYKIKLSD